MYPEGSERLGDKLTEPVTGLGQGQSFLNMSNRWLRPLIYIVHGNRMKHWVMIIPGKQKQILRGSHECKS